MPKFLFRGSYSQTGIKGVLKDGGSGRKDAAAALAQSLGGRLEGFYFAFGSHDFYAIGDLPDNAAAVALAATVGASGAMSSFETVPLLTPEEADEAMRRSASYRPPGS
jgi:uncharacterized protein with GYD domain